ncbi:MAG TPA: hypothetical protein VFG68_16835 [Fimbriiglobus sp.]|nr:hypothetical protein [Fimbriiglobus sp.]
MNGLLADANILGQLGRLLSALRSAEWAPFWEDLTIPVVGFDALGLAHDAPDRVVWNACQRAGFILLTANRNNDGPDSLDAAIRDGPATSLPVLTIADAARVMHDGIYALQVAIDLLDYLTDLRDVPDKLLGAGRLYLPKQPL